MPANQQGYIVLKGWSICSGGHRLFAPAEGGQYTPAETGFSIRLFHIILQLINTSIRNVNKGEISGLVEYQLVKNS